MPHDTPLLTLLAAAFAAAWVLGLLAQKLRLSPIVGYLLAGVVIGPHTPGFVGDVALASQLAEVGVVLLMFGVGLHFHLRDLLAVKGIALPGALIQSGVATLLGLGLGLAEGWPIAQGLVLGMALSVASTVVLLRVLEEHDLLSTPAGHAAIGWLIVEDILTVVVLVVIPALGRRARPSGGLLSVARGLAREAGRAGGARLPGGLARAAVGAHGGGAPALARAVHAHGPGAGDGGRRRRCVPVRRLDGAGRVPGRDGGGAVAGQPSGGRGRAAPARRVRGALLRVGGDAASTRRSCCASRCCWWAAWRSC